MGKINIDEYVRTKNGYIIRVDENTNIFNLGYKEQYIDMETTIYGFTWEEEIVKHSKQLIDLIEVGDIVNGFPVLEPVYNGNAMYGVDEGYENFKKSFGEIKTILTKEQMEANCYKVGGENGI